MEVLQLPRSRRCPLANIRRLTHCSKWLTPRLAAISHQPSSLLFPDSRTELTQNRLCPLLITSRHGPHRKHSSFTVVSGLVAAECVYHRKHRSSVAVPLLRWCLLLRERIYRVVAPKRSWYIHPTRGRCNVTALHATVIWMMNWKRSGRNDRGLVEVLSQHLPGRTRENHD
jgi:hypothetical protein